MPGEFLPLPARSSMTCVRTFCERRARFPLVEGGFPTFCEVHFIGSIFPVGRTQEALELAMPRRAHPYFDK